MGWDYNRGMVFDVAVVGKGLFGAAAARYLSAFGGSVVVIGPDEPAADDATVYASHYDEGRLTGLFGRSPVWSRLAQHSLRSHPDLEAASGIRFYDPVGRLRVHHHPKDEAQLDAISAKFDAPYALLTPVELAERFPYFQFPTACQRLYEPAPAGMINPRALIRAQLAVAAQHGAVVVREVATAVQPTPSSVTITLQNGATIHARKLLLATGAFTNAFNLLPRPLDLRVKSETILLAEVTPADAARLGGMPVVDYDLSTPLLDDFYLTPPVGYPDGRLALKLGCNTAVDHWFDTLAEMQAWFRSGDSDGVRDAMTAVLRRILPDVVPRSVQTRRCIVCYTPHRHPFIDTAVADQVYVAVGGNGTGAHASDGVGFVAAHLMAHGRVPAGYDPAAFALAFAETP